MRFRRWSGSSRVKVGSIWPGYTERRNAIFWGAAFLGERALRLDRRSGRSGDAGVHQKPGAGGQPLGANEFVALIGHLQVANEFGVASATPTAASSGPIPKAPGFAGGYLLCSTPRTTRGVLQTSQKRPEIAGSKGRGGAKLRERFRRPRPKAVVLPLHHSPPKWLILQHFFRKFSKIAKEFSKSSVWQR
jgi:hypothetical protein